MFVTLFGMMTELRSEHSENAEVPILVTLLGIFIDVRPKQLWKATVPMLVTLLGMIDVLQPAIRVLLAVSIIALQLSRESYFGFSDATSMDTRFEQPRNTEPPMLVTLFGIVTEVSPEHLSKAEPTILVTLFGIVTEVSPEQA